MSDMKTHWSGFLTALNKTPTPKSSNSFETSSTQIGVSGFLDLKPTKPEMQKYDAMSASWEGVEASEKSFLKSKADKTEFLSWKS